MRFSTTSSLAISCLALALGCGAAVTVPTEMASAAVPPTTTHVQAAPPAAPADDAVSPEPESITVRAESGGGTASVALPNVFFGLPVCGNGKVRSDLRTEYLGEVACRDERGELDGPYASNHLDPTVEETSGLAERGQYDRGRRVGTWFQMHWAAAAVSYEVDTYLNGELLGRHSIAANGVPWRDPAFSPTTASLETTVRDADTSARKKPVRSMAD
jgi:hypothetical protein